MGKLAITGPATGETVGWRLSPILTMAVTMAVVLQLQSPPAGADTERVKLEDRRFSPDRIDISVGDTVVWKARDDRHTVTAGDGAFDSGPSGLMVEGDEFRWRFTTAGTYPYFCRIHQDQGMQGEVVVLGDPADRAAGSSPTTSRPPPVAPQGTAAPAPSSTTTTAQPSTTTTSRPLATSSTVNLATTTTGPVTAPVTPREPPTLDPDVASGTPPEESVPGTAAAVRRHRGTDPSSTTRLGLIVGLPAAAAATLVVSLRRRRRRASP